MKLNINEPVNFTPEQFVAAAGITDPPNTSDWGFDTASAKPTGLTIAWMKLSGTPTALGTWDVRTVRYNDYGDQVQVHLVTVEVIDPNAPEPEPEPPVEEPEQPTPAPDPIGQRVADFLGQGEDPELVALAGQHALIITAMVRAYTRGKGFTGTTPAEDLAAVITTATARLVTNPEQLDITVGGTRIGKGFQGWTLAETFVLNNYRRRAG